MNKIILFSFLLFSNSLFSQNISKNVIIEYEDTLSVIANTIMNGETEKIRTHANIGFLSELKEVLKYKKSYLYPFDKLVTISKLYPKDNSFRLFSWILKKEDGSYNYFNLIILEATGKNDFNTIIELKDNKNVLNSEKNTLNKDNWYGALIYKIISPKKKNNKLYTILAWDGSNSKSTTKIIDVIEIKNKEVSFGKDIFINGKTVSKRIIYKYNSNTSASVNYEEENKRIIMDHLVPLKENQEGFNQFYVTDGSYDCYQYKNGTWMFTQNIDVRTKTTLPVIKKAKSDKGLFNN